MVVVRPGNRKLVLVRMKENRSLLLLFVLLCLAIGCWLWLIPIGPFREKDHVVHIDASLEPKSAVWPKVVLFGDSLTEQSFSHNGTWASILADRLARKADVVVRGFGGYNTRMAKVMLPAIFNSFGAPIAAVTVFFGANDANPRTKRPYFRVPLKEYQDNLKWIVEYLEKRGVGRKKVVLIAPPVFDAERWSQRRDRPPLIDNYTAAYAKACGKVAAELGCEFLDWYGIMEDDYKEQWKTFLRDDGLHFSPDGSSVLAASLWPWMEKRTADLPCIMPSYTTINYGNPAVTFDDWLINYQVPTLA